MTNHERGSLRAHAPRRLRENLLRHFPQRDAELEHGRYRPAPPPAHLPMSADKLDLRPRRQIEQQRNFLAIKLLRKSHDRLGIPRGFSAEVLSRGNSAAAQSD